VPRGTLHGPPCPSNGREEDRDRVDELSCHVTDVHWAVVLLSLLSCLTTCLGVALALAVRESARAVAAGIGFSAGIMILIASLELGPAAIAAMGAGPALLAAGLGAGLIFAAHLVVPHVHLFEEPGLGDRIVRRSALLVALGMILHDVPEGFAMANAYVASPSLGVLVALAVALHNLPEEFVIALPAVSVRNRRFLFAAAIVSALAEPLGAILGLAAVGVAAALNAPFLAFAAGAMIFISVHELAPLARRHGHAEMFVLGAILSAAAYALLAWVSIGRVGGFAP
jgi:ZIP family zinc transporter